ncbi:hypothetical protein HanRHA438_Chr01g0046671 [Helianthus annuus]|nr:hypothetical protein HanRHA438_Chr01g0046671 [Helianthus annuus]
MTFTSNLVSLCLWRPHNIYNDVLKIGFLSYTGLCSKMVQSVEPGCIRQLNRVTS